jgi:hypothetical protein
MISLELLYNFYTILINLFFKLSIGSLFLHVSLTYSIINLKKKKLLKLYRNYKHIIPLSNRMNQARIKCNCILIST